MDVVGGLNLKKYFGDKALSVFVKPPSIEALRERLELRHTETEESIARRIAKAEVELKYSDKFDAILENADLKTAFAEAQTLVNKFLEG